MKKLYVILILAIISFWNATYLTIEALKYKAWDTWKFLCDINNTLSCSNLFSFKFSWIFGIPFPMIAMVVYPIIALVAILWILKKCKKTFEILFWIGIWWMIFNGYIIYNEFQVWVFCPSCLACTFAITTITILSGISLKQKNNS
jgi:uncharacterized membrane protein